MTFDEIQMIWDSQGEIDSSIDRAELAKWIEVKNTSFNRIVSAVEIAMMLMLLFLAVMFLKDPVLQGHDRALIWGAAASFVATGFIWTGRIARQRRELNYEDSLLGMIQKSIDGITYQINRLRSFIWLFTFPGAVGLAIGLLIVDDSKRHLFYTVFIPSFIACMALAYWQVRREIRMQLAPEKQRLEELRKMLRSESEP